MKEGLEFFICKCCFQIIICKCCFQIIIYNQSILNEQIK